MVASRRRHLTLLILLLAVVLLSLRWRSSDHPPTYSTDLPSGNNDFIWRTLPPSYPVTSFAPIPTRASRPPTKIQAAFPPESPAAREHRLQRRDEVKAAFLRCWNTYKKHAWLRDEVTPESGKAKNTFGGWGATLVDSLDTLWIMGLRDEFDAAVEAVDKHVSFATTLSPEINVFETTIRFLGGLLSAYDLSGDKRLLSKARDVGDLLYKAFDTPNHLPVARWDPHAAALGAAQTAPRQILLAELASLSMEFTRLSILTRDPKYHDAVHRISELLSLSQMGTKLPGLWPITINAAEEKFDAGSQYTLGGMADSAYEYLVKMDALLGDAAPPMYREMYVNSMEAAQRHLFFRPLAPDEDDILISGLVRAHRNDKGEVETELEPIGQHLTCFAGGMLALGAQLLSNKTHLELATKLTNGCVWAYKSLPTGIMPESFHAVPCASPAHCAWDRDLWHRHLLKHQNAYSKSNLAAVEAMIGTQRLPEGFTAIDDPRYILRPEAIESVFVLYRATGDTSLPHRAWDMWMAIEAATRTDLANTAVWSVNPPEGAKAQSADSMESFWLGETLKYFYLVFSEPELISLDEWVFNTEAHPFRRLGA